MITSRRSVAALAFGLLAGCAGLTSDLGLLTSAPRSALAFGGLVRVQAPDGFCVDRASSQLLVGFATLVPCAVLDDSAELADDPAFITVQFGRAETAGVAGSEQDLRQLIRANGPQSPLREEQINRILTTSVESGLVAVQYEGAVPAALTGVSGQVWRGFADVDDRAVIVSLRGYEASPLSASRGRALLFSTIEALRGEAR